MKRLYRSLAHNYTEGGLRQLLAKAVAVPARLMFSTDEWLVYEQTPIRLADDATFRTTHQRLDFDDLVRWEYAKVLSFPENIRRRFARGDTCHGFFADGKLVTLGWSGAHYMELNHDETLSCLSAWGLFDFVTLPAFQGRGYYTDALRQLARLAHDAGFSSLWIAVHPANQPSIKGIERAGFRPARKLSKRRVLGVSTLRHHALEH